MGPLRCAVLAMLLVVGARAARASGERQAADEPTPPGSDAPPIEPDESAENPWAISFSAYTYIIPHESDYVQPTLAVDHDWFHFEARYNYEDLDTASVWLGYNLSFGEELTLDFTPMIGGVFGETDGVAPGYEITLAWRRLELYTEGEYVIDTNDSSDSFFYTWSQLTYSFTDWLYAGVVIQRTKAYDTDFDIQRGLIAGVTHDWLDVNASVLNPDDDDPIVILGVGISLEF